MPKKAFPKKSVSSYLLPFFFILLLLGSGWFVIRNQVSLDKLKKIFQSSEAPKEKIEVIYQEGKNQVRSITEDGKLITEKTELQVADIIKTDQKGVLVLRFFDDSEVRFGESTELKIIRLEKDDVKGNHIALELTKGKLFLRSHDGNTENADFVITAKHMSLQMNKESALDIGVSPEAVRVFQGIVTANVVEKISVSKKPIARLSIKEGEELLITPDLLSKLTQDESIILNAISQDYLKSEWYLWNKDKEERLGRKLVESTLAESKAPEMEQLSEDLVTVLSPKENQKVGSRVRVQGTFKPENVSIIWINDQKATLDFSENFEGTVTITKEKPEIMITATQKDQTEKKLVKKITLQVDDTGPLLGKIIQPPVDENDNGVLTSDKLELIGEVDTNATQICVSYNDEEAYCLKQFKSGSKTYRYLGGVSYGNVKKGKNKYQIFAYDTLNNFTTKTLYLFKDEAKPEAKIEETTPLPLPSSAPTDFPKPVILSPDPGAPFETSEEMLTISGTTDKRTQTLLVNGKKANYTPGSENFEITLTLQEGENVLKFQALDSLGKKSKTATLSVIYIKKIETQENPETKVVP